MEALFVKLLMFFTPYVMDAIEAYRARHNGEKPTKDGLVADIDAHADMYLGEIGDWRRTHPPSAPVDPVN